MQEFPFIHGGCVPPWAPEAAGTTEPRLLCGRALNSMGLEAPTPTQSTIRVQLLAPQKPNYRQPYPTQWIHTCFTCYTCYILDSYNEVSWRKENLIKNHKEENNLQHLLKKIRVRTRVAQGRAVLCFSRTCRPVIKLTFYGAHSKGRTAASHPGEPS